MGGDVLYEVGRYVNLFKGYREDLVKLVYITDDKFYSFDTGKTYAIGYLLTNAISAEVEFSSLDELTEPMTSEEAYFYLAREHPNVFKCFDFVDSVDTIEKYMEKFFQTNIDRFGILDITDIYEKECPCDCEHLYRDMDEGFIFFKCNKFCKHLACTEVDGDLYPDKCIACKIDINRGAKDFYDLLYGLNLTDFRVNDIRFMIQHFCGLTMIDYDKYIEIFFKYNAQNS